MAKAKGKWHAEFAGLPFNQARLMDKDTQVGMVFKMPLGERIAALLNAEDDPRPARKGGKRKSK